MQAAQPSKARGHERQQTIREVGAQIGNTGSTVTGDWFHLQGIGVQVYSHNSMPFQFCQVQVSLVHHSSAAQATGNGRRNIEVFHPLAACCMCVWQAPSLADSHRGSVATRAACPHAHLWHGSTRFQISGVDHDYLVPFRPVGVREKELVDTAPPGHIQGQTCQGPTAQRQTAPCRPYTPKPPPSGAAAAHAAAPRAFGLTGRDARDQLRHSLAAPTRRCRVRIRRAHSPVG